VFKGFFIGLSVLSVLFAIATAGAIFHFYRVEFPDVSALKAQYPVVHYQGPQKPFTITLQKARPPRWVSLSDISKVAVGAIVVSEDWAFFQHKGYDPNQIRLALHDSFEEGELTRGASTITQQVVKNVFLNQEKSLWRKVKELYLAVELERATSKRKILESYLNTAEWGEGLFGIEQASRHYFDKPPSQLTAKEGAFLAMLLPSPKRYAQSFRQHQLTNYARSTIEDILEKMTQAHYLDPVEYDVERSKPLPFEFSAGHSLTI
jgi:monofunctional biosynthetic peptidoglycan transglycosylase